MRKIVSIADMGISQDEDGSLITYSLGSCIGVVIYDPVARVGGLLHYMLPESNLDPQKALKKPYMFADTGIPLLFKESYRFGAVKNRLIVKVAGGAQILDDSGFFNIGKRNYMAMRKLLWKNNILIKAEDVGGQVSRTVRLEMSTGEVWIKYSGEEEKKL
ncbi:MAG TPA: chemotaxis protein CheD [Thermodesulfobacteriota bacterium]|nr:chemotaxis protein CheD [Thermodesulfobacteriota bacterium]